MATETATFALKIEADAEPAAESAAALESFRAAVEKSQSAITSYRKSMSLLKGSSDEVKDAKEKLKAAIAAEQAAVTKSNLGILNLRGSYDKLAKAQKATKDSSEAQKKAITAIGGPVKEVTERFGALKELLPALTSGWGLLAVGVAAGVAALK